jgi:hypothetical protein
MWRQSAKVVLRSPARFFGGPVEMDHGVIAAQVYEDGGDAGVESTVHVYAQRGSALHRIAILRSRDGLPGASYGTSLAFEDHLLVAGAPGDDASQGLAYVYLSIGRFLIPLDRLVASDGAPADGFGASVAVRKGIIVAGAPGADLGIDDESYGRLRGNVYVFAPGRRGWYEVQKLNDGTDPDPLPGIGSDVALGHDLLAIKADDITGTIRGEDRVFVYDRMHRIFQQRQQVARFEGNIPDIDMSGRRLIVSKHVTPVFTYYVTGSATIYTFGKANTLP